jgi:SAM-dependent methyltransferase
MVASSPYVLGHSDFEMERLRLQAQVIGPVTERLVAASGISSGQSVLEIGGGGGDVSLLLSRTVGPSGKVVAFDREPKAVDTTLSRARAQGMGNIECFIASDFDFLERLDFDAAIGRYVLVHQGNPAEMVRDAAARVRRGGVIAFHELSFEASAVFRSYPRTPLFSSLSEVTSTAFGKRLPCPNVGDQLIQVFAAAGLPPPKLIWECVAGDWQTKIARWLVMSYLSMSEHVKSLGLDDSALGDPSTLADRIEAELKSANAQVVSRPQICAWSHVP